MRVAVSVIIPVYNVEKYLEKCLDSVLSQTFTNIEIIVLNDGSTDNSSEILKRYQEIENIKLINKENEGLSETRNKGLLQAQGEYVLFIDSDDSITNNMVEVMYKQAQTTDADIVVSKAMNEYEDGSKEDMFSNDFNEQEIIGNMEALRRFWSGEINGHIWNKLIRRRLMIDNKITFPKGKLYEDAPTLIHLIKHSQKLSFVNQSLYFYLQRQGSITKKPTYKALVDHIAILSEIEANIEEDVYKRLYNEEFQFFLLNTLYFNIYLLNQLYPDDKEAYKTYKRSLSKYINALNINNLFRNKYLNSSNKVRLMLIKTGLVYMLRYRYR
ncbi:glycosyltransferase family 2 protein [Metabacillus schmidteae]|uniref:glycosyltransferase family 2 protein n=1 Tax=Metabacillus schmidteae TaxID=2730405 RepID=UPI00158ED0D6|nr:glycosyltransferase [Metabacillus schmidteae]